MEKKKITGTLSSDEYYNMILDNAIEDCLNYPYEKLSNIVQKNIDKVGRKLLKLKPNEIRISLHSGLLFELSIYDITVKVLTDWDVDYDMDKVFFSVYSSECKMTLYNGLKPVDEGIDDIYHMLYQKICSNKYMSLNDLKKDYYKACKNPYKVSYLIHDENHLISLNKFCFIIDRLPDFKYCKFPHEDLIMGCDNGIHDVIFHDKTVKIDEKKSFTLPGDDGSEIKCNNSWSHTIDDPVLSVPVPGVIYVAATTLEKYKEKKGFCGYYLMNENLYKYLIYSFEGDIYTPEEFYEYIFKNEKK